MERRNFIIILLTSLLVVLSVTPALSQTLQYDTGDTSFRRGFVGRVIGNRFTGLAPGGAITSVSFYVHGNGNTQFMFPAVTPVIFDQLAGSTVQTVGFLARQPFLSDFTGFITANGFSSAYAGTTAAVGLYNSYDVDMALDANDGGNGFHAAVWNIIGQNFTQGTTVTTQGDNVNLANYNLVLRISGTNLPVELLNFEAE